MVTLLKQCQESCNDINLSVQATNYQAAGLFSIPYKEVQYANTKETHYLSWLRNIHTCSQDNLFTVEQPIVCWQEFPIPFQSSLVRSPYVQDPGNEDRDNNLVQAYICFIESSQPPPNRPQFSSLPAK